MPAPLATRSAGSRIAVSGLLLASAIGLAGCAGTGAAASPPGSSEQPGMSHSDMGHADASDGAGSDAETSDGGMSDGGMSDGGQSDGGQSDSDQSDGGMNAAAVEPSPAAAMICGADIRDAIASVLGLPRPVEGEDSIMGGHYTCTYPLDGGPLELAVHEAADPAGAQAYADSIRGDYGSAEDIEGLANLGYPAYRTNEGAVVFVKDSMVLVVDARAVAVPDGADAPSRTDAAYQIATNVLACWREHHSG
jgi:hypothetical protein